MKTKLYTGVPLFLVLLMFCTVVAPSAAENQVLRPQPMEEKGDLPMDIEIIKISEEIKNSTPYWILLTADEAGQKSVIERIGFLDISDDEKERMSSFMKEIWTKYPVKFEKVSNIIYVNFDTEKSSIKLTEGECRSLEKISLAIADYQRTVSMGDDNSPMWNGGQHWDILYLSVKKWGYSDYLADLAKNAADDPDFWPPIYPPTEWEEFDDFITKVCHSWDHYYNPSLLTGFAPQRCAEFAGNAKTKIDQGDWNNAMRDLGWSGHFITDVGNPLHTGKEAEQALNEWVHYDYESYVEDNWVNEVDPSLSFKAVIDNNWVYHTVYSPDVTTRLLAGFSKDYEDTIFWTIYFNPDGFYSDPNIRSATEACLLSTAQDTLGLVKYVVD